jgi:hypothetical protein
MLLKTRICRADIERIASPSSKTVILLSAFGSRRTNTILSTVLGGLDLAVSRPLVYQYSALGLLKVLSA